MLARMVIRRSALYGGCQLVFSGMGCIPLTLLQLRIVVWSRGVAGM